MVNLERGKIEFDYANLYLKPELTDSVYQKSWREDFRRGNLHMSSGRVILSLQDQFLLEMNGVSIPLESMKKIRSHGDVVRAIKDFLGDYEKNVKKYLNLVDKGIVQDNLYFNYRGLCDYSKAQKLEGKDVSQWIREAEQFSGDVRTYFPKEFGLPVMGVRVEFVPTYQALRDIRNFQSKEHSSKLFFTGGTLDEMVGSFLEAYDAVEAHLKWKEQEERKVFLKRREGIDVPSEIPIAKFIF